LKSSREIEVQPVAPIESDSLAMAKPLGKNPPNPTAGPGVPCWHWPSLLWRNVPGIRQPTGRQPLGSFFMCLPLECWPGHFLSKEWTLAPLPETGTASDMLQVRWIPLVIAVPLTLAAFLTFTNNLFTPLNVTLWVLDIICIVWGFWLPGRACGRPGRASRLS